MPTSYQGSSLGAGLRIGIVVSRFASQVTSALLEGALEALERHGVASADIDVARVPGSLEIPLVAQRLAQSGRYDALVCLGAVIRGETPHFEYVAGQASAGISQVSLSTGVPIGFGVLTTNNFEQALERAGGKSSKGSEAAVAALEMANLLRALGTPGRPRRRRRRAAPEVGA